MPTGWEVMTDLISRVATADGSAVSLETDDDFEQWWQKNGSGPLGYSSLLQVLGPTPAARQALLAGYFEPNEQDREEGRKVPTRAHRAIAAMAARGDVKVILTTNFDRLMEQALDAEGVAPQVISRPEATKGMTPLVHAGVTLIKLHGDYKDQESLNTADELKTYPKEWDDVLSQVFGEFGVLVSGWSADWDIALANQLESAVRRYPLFWDSRSGTGNRARQLLAARSGQVVLSPGADELFTELNEALLSLRTLAEPPLTTEMALVRMKRYLLDPTRRIDVFDLLMRKTDVVEAAAGRLGVNFAMSYDDTLQEYLQVVTPLLTLTIEGIRHDREGTHDPTFTKVFERLLAARGNVVNGGPYNEAAWQAQHYPALLYLLTVGAACIDRDNETLFVNLATRSTWRSPFSTEQTGPDAAIQVLRPDALLNWEDVGALPRWNGTQWQQPPSHLTCTDLTPLLQKLTDDPQALFHDVEYRMSLIAWKLDRSWTLGGEFARNLYWANGVVPAHNRFLGIAAHEGEAWPWWSLLGVRAGELDALTLAIAAHHQELTRRV